ncbi:hypothetical protein L1049_010690 [Liquidambar formosana]|uniref:Cupin type-1 domain-containing protein n=1 Tax=Liquidambar formosana TaxID=63359 RepID=A0AAP0N805_LIQFO
MSENGERGGNMRKLRKGFHLTGNTSNPLRSKVTPITVPQVPRLNTLGISMVRIDIAPWVVNPPHTHPRAIGLIHLQRNVGTSNAVAIAALNSQNPGIIGIADAMFGPKPDIPEDILVKAFQVDKDVISQLQGNF